MSGKSAPAGRHRTQPSPHRARTHRAPKPPLRLIRQKARRAATFIFFTVTPRHAFAPGMIASVLPASSEGFLHGDTSSAAKRCSASFQHRSLPSCSSSALDHRFALRPCYGRRPRRPALSTFGPRPRLPPPGRPGLPAVNFPRPSHLRHHLPRPASPPPWPTWPTSPPRAPRRRLRDVERRLRHRLRPRPAVGGPCSATSTRACPFCPFSPQLSHQRPLRSLRPARIPLQQTTAAPSPGPAPTPSVPSHSSVATPA